MAGLKRMTDNLIRIKAARPSYRRAGLALGANWTEVDTSNLSADQKRALLGDAALTIEGHEGDGTWSPLSAEIRAGLLVVLEDAEEGREAFGREQTGGLSEADEEALDVGRNLISLVEDNRDLLDSVGLWPVEEPERLFLDVVNRLVRTEGDMAATATLEAAIEPHQATLVDLGIPIADRAEVIPRLMAALIEARAAKNTPASDEPDGGRGVPAAPSEGDGEESQRSGPETAGNTDPAPDGPPAPNPTRKGGKPAKRTAG